MRGRRTGWTVGLAACGLLAVGAGCSDLPVQIGHDSPSKVDRKGRVADIDQAHSTAQPAAAPAQAEPEDDPQYERAANTYRQSYTYWNAEQKQLEDNVAGNSVAYAGAHQRIVAHLTRMSRFLGPTDREKLLDYVRQYQSMYQMVSSGNHGRLVSRQVAALGNHVRAEFSPSAATIVPLPVAGPDLPEGVAVVPRGGTEPGTNPDAPAGPGAAPDLAPDAALVNPKAPPDYVAAFSAWRTHHKALMDALFSDAPQIDEPYRLARADLERMQGLLPQETRESLQIFLNEYERSAQGFVNGESARRAVSQFRTIAGEIEKNFAPAAVRFP